MFLDSDLKRRPFRVNEPAKEVNTSADGVRRGAMGYGLNPVNIQENMMASYLYRILLRRTIVISYAAPISDG